jgi:hypothetical protein
MKIKKSKTNEEKYDYVYLKVYNFFNDYNKTNVWFATQNHLLGGYSPISLVKLGKTDKLINFIDTALEENIS